jgi:hypothetical protein
MPIFYDSIPATGPKNSLRRVGFFGHQSQHKGLFLLPNIVNHLIALGYEVIVQDSGGMVSGNQSRVLKILPAYIDDLANEMKNCDLIICPYDPKHYQLSGSGIAWEAISHGVPVIGPAETGIARFINETGAGVTFDAFNATSILSAVEVANSRYGEISLAAFNTSQIWSATHGSLKFIEKMLY